MKQPFLCKFLSQEYYVEAEDPNEASAKALNFYLTENSDLQTIPIAPIIEVAPETGESFFCFVPKILADLGFHKSSSDMMNKINTLTSGYLYA